MIDSNLCDLQPEVAVALRVRGLWKRYGKLAALADISFDLVKGEILGIIGPSGSGKTTLLRCLDLLESMDSGRIEFDGETAVEVDGTRAVAEDMVASQRVDFTENLAVTLRRRIGFVFQTFNLWEDRTVLQNLILAPMAVKGASRESASGRAECLCREFGLADKLLSRPWQLSGGQRQRVAIMRALMMQPTVLLLDEITSALDPVLTVDVMQAIRKLRDDRMTMVLVTHHMQFASSLCDRVAFLSQGRIMQTATPQELQEHPQNGEIKKFLAILREAT